MYPSITISNIKISCYSICALVGIIAFIVYFRLVVDKIEKIDRKSANRLFFCCLIGFAALVIFAAIFDSLFHSIEASVEAGYLIIEIYGITWLGGVVGMIATMLFCIHKLVPYYKGREVELFSLIFPGIILGHAFGRIGCFLGGCCYGMQVDSFLSVVFPSGSPAALQYPAADGNSLPVLPTQLFESVFEFMLFLICIVFYRKAKYRYLSIYCLSYGVFRFVLEFFRGDDRGSTGFLLSPAQFLCLFTVAFGIMLIVYQNQKGFASIRTKCQVWQKEASDRKQLDGIKDQYRHSIDELAVLKFQLESGKLNQEDYEKKKKETIEKL